MRQDIERAGERIREAVKQLQDRDIIDAEGRLIPTDTDMAPGSKATLAADPPRMIVIAGPPGSGKSSGIEGMLVSSTRTTARLS